MRLLALTIRFRVVDHCGITRKEFSQPVIWMTWHNRIFVMGHARCLYTKHRWGAVLASPSKDGQIIARFMERFGISSIQGSSNKRAAGALKEMIRWIRDGHDISITPDGPRGPMYHLQPGSVKLAQLTKTQVMPIRVDYSNAWKAKTWDQFRIPKPFSSVVVTFNELETVNRTRDENEFQAECARIEAIMRDKTGFTNAAEKGSPTV